MPSLLDEIPDASVLISLSPEELGRTLLKLASERLQRGMFTTDVVTGGSQLYNTPLGRGYPRGQEGEIEIAVNEAWHWLEINMLIMPADGSNGRNGWKVLTRRGSALANDEDGYRSYAAATTLPKGMLHPLLGDRIWIEMAQGQYPDAVFKAFRAVEVAVRTAGQFRPEDVGTDLMRKAFDAVRGPLRKPQDPAAEREALAHLFAGAIGSYKNPHSHRHVAITDAGEAWEAVVLASHLLRIVDSRTYIDPP